MDKELTKQIIQNSNSILNYFKSPLYQNAISGQDTSTLNSLYKSGDQGLGESIETLKEVCTVLDKSIVQLNKIDYNQRTNFNSYLVALLSWFQTNQLYNTCSNIIQYTNSLYTWIYQYGLAIPLTINEKTIKQLNKIELKSEDIQKITQLRIELESIKTASTLIDTAKDILSFTQNGDFIKKSVEFCTEAQKKIMAIEENIKEVDNIIKNKSATIDDLLSRATNASLARAFSYKIKEYRKSVDLWTKYNLIAFGVLILFNIALFYIKPLDTTNIYSALIGFLHRSPIFIPSIWLLIFLGNRRAENLKLKESYTHKESMALSFLGYQKQIEKLGESDIDKQLQVKNMDNLLTAIGKDSSIFLNSKGEKSPLQDLVTHKVIDKVT